jgi:hypothetical protein
VGPLKAAIASDSRISSILIGGLLVRRRVFLRRFAE